MSLGKKQIFIVDDDPSVCRALKMLLLSYTFDVITFNSAEEFFKEVSNSTEGCLILDIHMPGLDGWSTLQRLTASGSKRPVIIISAEKNGGLKDKALKIGAVGFFSKPVNDLDLVSLINQSFAK